MNLIISPEFFIVKVIGLMILFQVVKFYEEVNKIKMNSGK